jgi:hypothetical protein
VSGRRFQPADSASQRNPPTPKGSTVSSRRFQPADGVSQQNPPTPKGLTGVELPHVNVYADLLSHCLLHERPRADEYIKEQERHHRRTTFVEEYRKLLEEAGIEFDERYML